jgi:putative nucleic acid binding protein
MFLVIMESCNPVKTRPLFAYRNRGLLLDLTIFLFQLFLLRALTNLSLDFVHQAKDNAFAETIIGLFLIALFLLQLLGPILRRWSFHQHFPSFEEQLGALTGLFLSFYRFFYIGSMAIMIYLACTYFGDAFSLGHSPSAETLEKIVVAAALVLPVISSIFVFKFFVKPKREPRWKFLMTPQAEALGDLCMFFNVVCFQILFSVYFSSSHFWNALHKTTRLATGTFDSLSGRLYIAAIAALIVYLPPRIFYLVPPASIRRRLLTWLLMVLANLPLILSIVFYKPAAEAPREVHQATYAITASELHDEYAADHQGAMRKYMGQYVDITGAVQTRFFPRSLELNDQIGLDGKDGYPLAYCSFDEDQVESAEALELGQQVTLQCVGANNWTQGPSFEHCVAVR